MKRVSTGVYETEDGRFRVEKDVAWTEYDEWYLDRHPEINVYANNGVRAYTVWQVWDVQKDDYVDGGEEFETKKAAVVFLNRYMARQ